MTKTGVRIPSRPGAQTVRGDQWKKYVDGASWGNFDKFYRKFKQLQNGNNNEVPEWIHVHTALAIPFEEDFDHYRFAHFIKATPSHHGKPWYSDVAVAGTRVVRRLETREEWYGRLMLLFHARINGERKDLAYLR